MTGDPLASLKVQVALIPDDGEPVLLAGDPACNEDPCDRHGRCHCMCPCVPDGDDNCAACAEAFDD